MLDSFDLTGKTALVTGCSRGIGESMALALAAAGADIVGVSASLAPDGGSVGSAVTALGRRFTAYRCDFADRAAVTQLASTVSELGEVDILVNNAGTIERSPAVDHGDDLWDRVLEVNLSAQFVLSRELGRRMVERGRGKIVFTASLLSFQGGITVPGYAASKGGLLQLVKALANEWAPHGVNVNAIVPGYVRTDNTRPLQDDELRSRQILERIPAGRWGEVGDFRGPVVFLASSASDYMHGTALVVDGGWLAR